MMDSKWRPLSRKLEQVPLVKLLWKGGMELANYIWFWLMVKQRQDKYTAFKNCQDLEDYWKFSRQIFGLTQIKQEILGFLEFAQAEHPECVCEIGTAKGGTNFLLSQALPSIRLAIGVDLYVTNRPQLRYFSHPSRQINFVNGSSRAKWVINRDEDLLAGKKLDILFIDGDHSYEGVKYDFLNYRHLVQEGGLIVFHDIVPDYRTRYGRETPRWAGGVPKFWSQIKRLYPHYEFVKNTEQDGLGIGTIRYSQQVFVSDKTL